MHPITLNSFFSELEDLIGGPGRGGTDMSKIAAMKLAVADLRRAVRPKAKSVAKELNATFGLPAPTRRSQEPKYETGPSAALSADRTQNPVAGMSTPNISSSQTMSPAYGPGGV